MGNMDIGLTRLANQHIIDRPFMKPADAVAWLGALQAQDYLGALWSIGLRMAATPQLPTEALIEEALANHTIIRTWPMRGTLHFVAAEDVRWLLQLLTPRQIQQSAGRYRQLDLNEPTFAQSQAVFAEALEGGKELTREELMQALEHAGIASTGQRGYHMLVRAAQDGVICFGARSGKQQTFTLLAEWVPPTAPLPRDEALAKLAQRYFTSHGPATVHDLARWAGITVTDARRGVAGVDKILLCEMVGEQEYWLPYSTPAVVAQAEPVYLLPGFDEFVLGYGDRAAVLDPAYADRICPGGNGVFSPTVVIDGQIRGTWKRTLKTKAVAVEWTPFTS
ncbi:MAG: AlkZ family DNA glycosylase, partial [Caldilineaceae bacterium]|nr:AlkZ family DNA glycosylase [Caldilineaceae bacterium]